MSKQSMRPTRLIGRFRDVKALPYRLPGFEGIGVLMLVIDISRPLAF